MEAFRKFLAAFEIVKIVNNFGYFLNFFEELYFEFFWIFWTFCTAGKIFILSLRVALVPLLKLTNRMSSIGFG
jgi:hypothetical protein